MYWNIENKQNFYKSLVKMWEKHNFPVVPFHRMPQRIFVAYDKLEENEEPIILYAIPVYITDSSMAQIAFPTSNLEAPINLKQGVLEQLIAIIQVAMKAQGFDFIYTTSGDEKLMKLFKNQGFMSSDEGVTYYSKPL